ncbi:MAG: DNA polymerase III subunit gamma/tau [Anaerolineaceae bacterium]|jgi:DNA polymerase-3 subunit gamma/tau
MPQALYREYRPHLWEQVFGQDHIVHTLQNAIRSNRVGHAYLFAGPRGTGKTTTARLLAKAVNCLEGDPAKRPCDHCAHCIAVNENRFLDLIEIDAASNTSVDDVRDLRDKINFSPTQGIYKIYIIDEVHMLSTAAFNALLKTLEEPPAHAIFILATTEIHKIPATVLSRCQRHEFRRIPVKDIIKQLDIIVKAKSLSVDPEALTLIARQATGSMRDAISLLDQLTSTGEAVTLQNAQTVLGTATSQLVVDLVDAILQRQASGGLNAIHQALDSGTDPRQFARQVVEYLRGLLLMRLSNADQVDATAELRALMAQQAQAFDLPRLLGAVRLFNSAASEGRSGWQPSLPLELALADSIEGKFLPTTQPSLNPPSVSQGVPVKAAELPEPVHKPDHSEEKTIPPASNPKSARPEGISNSPTPSKPATGDSAPPSSPSTPAQEPASDASATLNRIGQNWPRVRMAVKKLRPSTEALLNSCKLLGMKNGALVLGFQGEIVKSKMETPENLELTRQAIASVTGASVSLICVVSNKAGTASNDLDIDRDGMVGTALNLGGQIVHKE